MTPPTWLHWPASWTPADLADLFAWYKADAITGLSDGDPVSTWSDSSGGGYDVTQTSTARPLYQTNTLNGLPVVEFDGNNDYLAASTAADWAFLNQAGGAEVVAVWKSGTSADPDAIYALCNTDNGSISNHGITIAQDTRSINSRDDAGVVVSRTSGSNFYLTVANNGFFPANTAGIFGVSLDLGNATAANKILLRANGGTAVTGNTQNENPSTSNPVNALQFGRFNGTFGWLDGYIAEVVICDALLSSTDREKLEGYLAHKWGLESNLPNTHPYRYSAP